jgi:chitodextrinase
MSTYFCTATVGRRGVAWRGLAVLLLAMVALTLGSADRADAAASSTTPCVSAPPPPHWNHVILLMFENHTWDQVIGAKDSRGNLLAPYITDLASKCGGSYSGTTGATPTNNWHDANYKVDGSFDGDYNSKPSYAVLTNGQSASVTGLVDDTYGTVANVDNIFNEARAAGLDAKSFYDGPSSTTPCASSNFDGGYHDPIRYYTDLGGQSSDPTTYCNTHDKTLTDFSTALNGGTLPAFSVILPTNGENMHDTTVSSIQTGDSWAKNFLPSVLDSAQYKSGDTAIFFLWDEETAIPNVLIAPSVIAGARVPTLSGNPVSHFSALRTFEEMLGLPLLGDAGKAPSLLGFFNGCASGGCTLPGPDTQAPSSPSNLTATKNTSSEVDLAWTASTDNVGVTGYNVLRNGAVIATVGGSTTTYADTSVAANASYTYTVTAFDAAGNVSQPSNSLTLTTPAAAADTTAPSAPTGLKANSVGGLQVNLNWNASTDNVGVTAYDIYRATGGGSFAVVGTVPGSTTAYSDSALAARTAYTYYVKARDAAGNVSGASNQASVTTKRR